MLYEKLRYVYKTEKLGPENVYNVDETGVQKEYLHVYGAFHLISKFVKKKVFDKKS